MYCLLTFLICIISLLQSFNRFTLKNRSRICIAAATTHTLFDNIKPGSDVIIFPAIFSVNGQAVLSILDVELSILSSSLPIIRCNTSMSIDFTLSDIIVSESMKKTYE